MKLGRPKRSSMQSTENPSAQRKRTRSTGNGDATTVGIRSAKRPKEPEHVDDSICDVTEHEIINEQGFELGFRFKESPTTDAEEESKNVQKEILRQMVRKVLSESPRKSGLLSRQEVEYLSLFHNNSQ